MNTLRKIFRKIKLFFKELFKTSTDKDLAAETENNSTFDIKCTSNEECTCNTCGTCDKAEIVMSSAEERENLKVEETNTEAEKEQAGIEEVQLLPRPDVPVNMVSVCEGAKTYFEDFDATTEHVLGPETFKGAVRSRLSMLTVKELRELMKKINTDNADGYPVFTGGVSHLSKHAMENILYYVISTEAAFSFFNNSDITKEVLLSWLRTDMPVKYVYKKVNSHNSKKELIDEARLRIRMAANLAFNN